MKPFMLDAWRVDPDRLRLKRGDQEVILEPKSMDVLVYMAERAGEVVTAEELINGVWEGRAMGDGPIYGAIAKLRRALDDDAHDPRYIATISRRGYRLLCEPVWEESPKRDRYRRYGAVLGVIVLVGVLALVMLNRNPNQQAEVSGIDNGEISLAVLPFASLGGDERNEYLGWGFSEDLLNALSRTPGLRVIARASAFTLGNSDIEFSELADELGVDYILNGSVRLQGNQIRITTQLVDRDARLVWSESFDRDPDDVLDIQQEIASALADRLALSLSTYRTRTRVAGDAYKEYLLGRDYVRLGLIDWAAQAQEAFERAISIDPQFADAHAGLARVLHHEKDVEGAREQVELALSLDPESADAHFVNGLLAFPLQFDVAESHFRRALRLNPNLSEARQFLAFSLEGLNLRPEAFTERRIGLARDPLHYGLNRNIAFDYSATGELDKALSALNSAMDLPQSDIPALNHKMRVILDWTRYDQVIGLEDRYFDPGLDHPGFRADLAAALTLSYSRLGLGDQAAHWYQVARDQDGWPHLGPSLISRLQYLGETRQFDRMDEEIAVLNSDLPDFFPGTRAPAELEFEVIEAQIMVHVFKGEYQSALDLLEPLMESGDSGAEARQFMAVAYLHAGEPEAASKLLDSPLERALNIAQQGFAQYPAAQASLARLWLMKGDLPSAAQVLESAINLGWNGAGEVHNNPRWERLEALPESLEILNAAEAVNQVQRNAVIEMCPDTTGCEEKP